ncbi:putative MFS family arabinose efflux permease [Hydrogenophaga palleronii]|uniref:MFS family arabinose efflux permease n=1 Tax=Hydrogenophaga palleronii TaxID=65655 RepID=A0ABU1WRV8_9BURK|nr:MFS transporter [Hydrogenophaga palleronii]MDR7152048.1 putative MFS family arabinose efflux permease [Hydrogenophaga palleronii]
MAAMSARVSLPLAASYVGFFLPAGVLLSYLPLFLAGKGLQAAEVGLIFSAVFAVKLMTGPAIAWWADRRQRQNLLLAVAAWTSVACGVLLSVSDRFELVLLSVICIAVCRNYFQCMLEALATRIKNSGAAPRYGLMRGIGSTSVCLGVVLFGGLWAAGPSYQQVVLPLMILASGFVLIICLRAVGSANVIASRPDPVADAALNGSARDRVVSQLLLLLGATLLIGANGVFYSTATLLMSERGVNPAGIAVLWCVAFGVEALGFAAFDRLRVWCGTLWFFAAAVALALVRWFLFTQNGELMWMAVAFALHVTSFSWLHAFCANWVRDSGPAKFAVTAQALYTACAHGIGMAVAAYFASMLLPSHGSSVYWIAAAMTLSGALALGLRAALEGVPRGIKSTTI